MRFLLRNKHESGEKSIKLFVDNKKDLTFAAHKKNQIVEQEWL